MIDLPEFEIVPEMLRLRRWLDEQKIERQDNSDISTCFWICRTKFKHKGIEWSVVNGFGTYGGFSLPLDAHNQGLLEAYMPRQGKEPFGYLTCEELIEIVENGGEEP